MSEYEAEYKAVDKQEKVVKRSGFGVASLVLGIIGICISFIPIVNYLSFVLGLLALIFGIVSLIKKASKGMATAGLILGILAIIVAYNIHTVFSNVLKEVLENNTIEEITENSTDRLLEKYVGVEIGKFEVTKNEFWADTSLQVKVTNKADSIKSFRIQLEAVDNNGDRIDEDYIYVNSLGAGQSQTFEAFEFISSDMVEKLENATFKVVDVAMY